MNLSKIRRIDKLELLAGIGKQAPCKLMIYQILEGVKSIHREIIHQGGDRRWCLM